MRIPPPLPAYVGKYIGVLYADEGAPPKSFNCWQLFAHVQRAERGVELPDYGGPVWGGRKGLAAMVAAAEAFAQRFTPIQAGQEREGDAVLLRLEGAPIHIGLVVAQGWMLHVYKGIDGCVEDYGAPHWINRIAGFYRP